MNHSKAHPRSEDLVAFAHGKLAGAQLSSVESHIEGCDSCCRFLQDVPDDGLLGQLREANGDTIEGSPAADTMAASAAKAPADGAIPPELASHAKYEVLRVIGAGGMGVVYEARQPKMGRSVALKVINSKFISHPGAVERFEREAVAAGSLSHPNIVTAHDVEQAGDLHFLVMEYVDGVSLSELIKKRGPLPVKHACNFVVQAAMGLQHALKRGMVHRDIKPQNLMRTSEGRIKILDFGLARLGEQFEQSDDHEALTGEGVTLGTPDFIAPEQARSSRSADIRADIYSLGCTLYYLLCAQPPYPSGTAIEKILAHCEQPTPSIREQRPDVPAALDAILQKMMNKSAAARHQTPQEVVDELKAFGQGKRDSEDKSPVTGSPNVSTAAASVSAGATTPASATPSQPTQVAAQSPVATLASPAAPLEPPVDSDPLQIADLSVEAPKSLASVGSRGRKRADDTGKEVMRWAAIGGGAVVGLVLLMSLAPFIGGMLSSGDGSQQQAGQGGGGESKADKRQDPQQNQAKTPTPHATKRVLVVLPHDGYWYADYHPVRAALDKAKLEVTIASSYKGVGDEAFARSHIQDTSSGTDRTRIDLSIDQAQAEDYDAVVLVGGATEEFTDGDARGGTMRLLAEMNRRNKLVTSLCRGNEVLAVAGVLQGKDAAFNEFVAEPVVRASNANWIRGQPYVHSGNIITGRSYTDAKAFAQVLVRQLRPQ